ncbi:MAG: aminotransferase class IV family protein [Rhizobiaceae bacterium]
MPTENPLRGSGGRRFGLIETLRWEPGAGAVRGARHLDRMEASAGHFGKSFDRAQAEALLAEVAPSTAMRLRLLLDENSKLSLTRHIYLPLPGDTVWTAGIAATRLSSNDDILAHKTTRRELYEAARAEYPANEADEVLMENENGFVCEGTITSLFVEKDGTLVTPRLSHGLLRGVLRQEMLDTGIAVEGDLTRADLDRHPFFVGNSLRGLIWAKLKT